MVVGMKWNINTSSTAPKRFALFKLALLTCKVVHSGLFCLLKSHTPFFLSKVAFLEGWHCTPSFPSPRGQEVNNSLCQYSPGNLSSDDRDSLALAYFPTSADSCPLFLKQAKIWSRLLLLKREVPECQRLDITSLMPRNITGVVEKRQIVGTVANAFLDHPRFSRWSSELQINYGA